jgi:hypothetical protein
MMKEVKEEYLWNKIGEDPEIERLENALAVFRYVETEPPALPAKIIPFERKKPRGFLRLAFGFAAFASLAIVCLGVWFQFSSGKIEVVKDLPKTVETPVVQRTHGEIIAKNPDVLPVKKIEPTKKSIEIEQKVLKIKKVVPAIARQNNLIARRNEIKKPAVKLSEEEKYAYSQLMLALSITSSKLKLVEDKIYGTEKPETALENAR